MPSPAYFAPAPPVPRDQPPLEADIVVYGATSAGVAAAVTAARAGRSVVVLHPGWRVGGLSASGLGLTDIGHKGVIGGLSREFYRRIGGHYGDVPEEWRFEPHVAESVFQELLRETGVTVHFGQYLAGVDKTADNRLSAVRLEGGLTARGRVFMDCSYEGDLMAAAGVRSHVGREDNAVYGETLNGAQVLPKNQIHHPVDPYVREGDAASGLLPGIDPSPVVTGAGDARVQAYNFRLCLTKQPDNRVPFAKPTGFDPREYVLLARIHAAGWRETFPKFDPLRRNKTDTNNSEGISTDFIGRNWDYPEAGHAARERIYQEHVNYTRGYLWFMANDPSLPADARASYGEWGYAADEFTATDHFPHQLYVREARRLVGSLVMTEHHCRGNAVVDDPIAMAAYTMDSHNVRRFVTDEGFVKNEGDVQAHGFPPYPISYRAIVPERAQCVNLLVPVCLSASHIAYGSIRMEPVFIILGQSAALAADAALERATSNGGPVVVQDVPYADLRRRLETTGQVLAWTGGAATEPQYG